MKSKITKDLLAAMKNKDKLTLSVLRSLKAAITNKEKEIRANDLCEDECIKVLRSQIKQREDSAAMYSKGGNKERSTQELSEKVIIESYLPAQISKADVVIRVEQFALENKDKINKAGKGAIGIIVGTLKEEYGNSCSPKLISEVAREYLSK